MTRSPQKPWLWWLLISKKIFGLNASRGIVLSYVRPKKVLVLTLSLWYTYLNLPWNSMFCQLSQFYVVEFRRQNQNIFQKDHFRKFSENIFVWAYQVDIRDLKKSNNSIAIDSHHNIRPNYLIMYIHTYSKKCSMAT